MSSTGIVDKVLSLENGVNTVCRGFQGRKMGAEISRIEMIFIELSY